MHRQTPASSAPASAVPAEIPEGFSAQLALDSALCALRTGDFQTRWDAAKAIPAFGTDAIAPLLSILEEEDSDWELLWFTARILGNLDHPDAIAALVTLLKTTDHVEVAGMAATALASLGTDAIAPLACLLVDGSTRLLGVQALAQIRHADVVPSLLEVVHDPSPPVRAATLEALSHFYDATIFSALLTALQDPVASVRQVAVSSLGLQAEQHDKAALAHHLKPLLWDLNLDVCRQTAIAFGRIGTTAATNVLHEVLQSPQTPAEVQVEAVRALARIGTALALENLQQFLNLSSSTLAAEVIAVLGRVEPLESKIKATQILLHLLQTNHPAAHNPRNKQTIALCLGQLKQLEAIDPLIHLLADPNASVQFHAIAALKHLESETTYSRLRALAARKDLSTDLSKGIAIALQEWHV